MSHSQNVIHVVFSTTDPRKSILPEFQPRLWGGWIILPSLFGISGDFRCVFMLVCSFDVHEGVAPTALGILQNDLTRPPRRAGNGVKEASPAP